MLCVKFSKHCYTRIVRFEIGIRIVELRQLNDFEIDLVAIYEAYVVMTTIDFIRQPKRHATPVCLDDQSMESVVGKIVTPAFHQKSLFAVL